MKVLGLGFMFNKYMVGTEGSSYSAGRLGHDTMQGAQNSPYSAGKVAIWFWGATKEGCALPSSSPILCFLHGACSSIKKLHPFVKNYILTHYCLAG